MGRVVRGSPRWRVAGWTGGLVSTGMEQESALIDAAARGDLGRVIDLVARGANPNAADCDGWTPLLRAALVGSREIVTLLLDAGADVNLRGPDGSTALLKATLWRHVNVAQVPARSRRQRARDRRPRVDSARSGAVDRARRVGGDAAERCGREGEAVSRGLQRAGGDGT